MDELLKSRNIHGGDIYSYKGEDILDLSSNINPRELPLEVIEALPSILKKAGRYPDAEYRELKEALCNYLNDQLIKQSDEKSDEILKKSDENKIAPSNITLGNGAVEILDKVISLFKNIIIIRPSFIEYSLSALRYGSEITYVNRQMDFEYGIIGFHTIKDVEKSIKEDSLVIICNPNNPDGAIYDLEAVTCLLNKLKEKNSFLLVDETFAEYLGRKDLNALTLVPFYDNLIVVKALTKFFGLPGVRLGYGITKNEELNKKIISRQTTWNVGAFAENIGKIIIKDKKYIEESIEDNKKNRRYLKEVLENTGLFKKIYPSFADFLTVSLKDDVDDDDFVELLKEKGILIRSLHNMQPFTKRDFRIAVKTKRDIERLKKELNNFIGSKGK